MTRAVPKEEREKIVTAYHKGLGTVSELSTIFNISEWSGDMNFVNEDIELAVKLKKPMWVVSDECWEFATKESSSAYGAECKPVLD